MNASELFRQALAACTRGDLRAARAHAVRLLAGRPGDASAHQLMGVVLSRAGDPRGGADHFRRALAARPTDDDLRVNLARALLDAGDPDAALAATRPYDARDLLLLRAEALVSLARPAEAAEACRIAVRARPDDAEAWNNLGNALVAAGDAAEAVAALERAVALRPAAPAVRGNLARALDAAGRPADALDAYREAAARAPEDGDAQLDLGRALQRLGRSAEALPVLGTAARLKRTDPSAYVLIGLAFAALADLGQAERAYRTALHVAPAHGPARLNLAILLERGNRLDELRALAATAEGTAEAADEARWVAAMLLRRDGRLAEALAIAEATEPPSLDPAIRAQFLGEIADRLGHTDAAFAAYDRMNRLTAARADTPDVAGDAYRRRIERMGERTTPEWYARWQPAPPPTERAPALLVGFLRSGTTLLDTMLMGHPAIRVMEEEPVLARIEEEVGDLDAVAALDGDAVRRLRTRYHALADTVAPPGDGLLLDKNPLATLRAPLVHRLFPDARFLFALRHPVDVVLSCWMQNFQVNEAMASFLDLADAARMYDAAMRYWEGCRTLLPLDVHTVRYEDLLADPEGEMRAVVAWLGLDWDDRLLDHAGTARDRGYIRTPSYAQVSEGLYARAAGRWERYRAHLAPILPILDPWARRFGYAPLV